MCVVFDRLEFGVSIDAQAEVPQLKREHADLRLTNETLKSASAFFTAELDHPQRAYYLP